MHNSPDNKSCVIHKHSLKCGGIGDFIRASLSIFSFCYRNKINYYINFDENPNLYQCFNIEKIPQNLSNSSFKEFVLLDGIYSINKIKPILESIIKPGLYYIKTNAVGFENNEEIIKIREFYFNNILKPSPKVTNLINDIYQKYNLIDDNYISIHIRCGDLNMTNNRSNSIDKRLNLCDENIYNNYNELINNFNQKYGDNMPIVIHSDSIVFKNKIKEINKNLIILDLDIKHIAENIGNNSENSFISTITEFYIVSKAHKIYMPVIYTGFSHMASIIESKPLYSKINSQYFDFLNTNNINII